MSSEAQNTETKQEKEDPGLTEFKEIALRNFVVEKALLLPEANCCTYNKGYIQQECFTCLTCFQETKKRAVICLACSIKCHEDHEIFPIGFKRNIRCDCGNTKYLIDCQIKNKNEIEYDNPGNCYNHNMENKYCFCDMEDDGNSTMAQCFFCEDWFHREHLRIFGVKKNEKESWGEKNTEQNSEIINNNSESESEDLPFFDLICKNCVKKIKDILVGYDLKQMLFGYMPEDHIKIIELEDDKENEVEEKSQYNNENQQHKKVELIPINEEKPNIKGNNNIEKIHEKTIIKNEEKLYKINDNNIIIKEENENKKENPLLLGKKRNSSLPSIDIDYKDKKEKNNDSQNNENIIFNNKIEKEKENNNKKDYLNNKIINKISYSKCKRKKYKEYEDLLNNIIQKEQSIFIDCEIFLNLLCRCKSCQEMYKEAGLDILNNKNLFKEWENRKSFDDVINDEKFIEKVEKENPLSLDNIEGNVNEFFNSKEYKELTFEQQIVVRAYISEFGSKLQEFVSSLNHETITVEDVYNFINKYKDHFEDFKNK